MMFFIAGGPTILEGQSLGHPGQQATEKITRRCVILGFRPGKAWFCKINRVKHNGA